MAGTTKALIGQDVSFTVDGIAVGCATQLDYTITSGMVDVTCASSGSWKEQKPGQLSWNGTVNGVTRITTGDDIATNVTSKQLFDNIKDGDLIVVSWTESDGTVDHDYSGSAYVSSLQKSAAPVAGGEATFSCSLEGTGALTCTVS